MPLSSSVYAAGVASGAVSWLIVRGVRLHAGRLGLIDQPNDRSSHRSPTPRGGGIGIVTGVAAGLVTASILADPLSARAWLLFGAAVLVAAVGLVDDFRRVTPAVRLLVQMSAAVALVAATGPIRNLPLPEPLDVAIGSDAVCWVLSILWIAAVTNFFNFMDGIDGLAGGQAAASFGGILIAAWAADAFVIAICAGAASLGFLLHNWSPARVFMGDVGSGFLGFVLAMAGAAVFRLPAAGWFALTIAVWVYLVERSMAGRRPGAHAKHV